MAATAERVRVPKAERLRQRQQMAENTPTIFDADLVMPETPCAKCGQATKVAKLPTSRDIRPTLCPECAVSPKPCQDCGGEATLPYVWHALYCQRCASERKIDPSDPLVRFRARMVYEERQSALHLQMAIERYGEGEDGKTIWTT